MERWVGKVAVVTGASAGIGESIAEKLVKAGVLVVGLARRVEKIEANAKKLSNCKGKLYAVKCDMTKEEDIVNAFQWTTKNVGLVHVLVNNAGGNPGTNLIDGDTSRWRQCFETNVIGLLSASREAIKIMRANNIEGQIVNISSVLAHVNMYFPTVNVYAATKHALNNLNDVIRQELNMNKLNIKVCSVSPGAVDTEFINDDNCPAAMRAMFDRTTFLKAEEVADTVMYVIGTPPSVHISEMIVRPPFSMC
ncbi:farnesol dehydrogenase-like [Atheta coriaria]|uniref:farnesol dehydrogenase-like n=1 Tax=Dalotia coriaria TaxID=877792 RepID=UPI0031F3B5B3